MLLHMGKRVNIQFQIEFSRTNWFFLDFFQNKFKTFILHFILHGITYGKNS